MPAWSVLPQFAKLVREAMKKAGGGPGATREASKAANIKVVNENPKWFKHMPGSGGKGTSAPKAASKKSNAWSRLSPKIKDQLLKKKGKGMSEKQLAKYRTMYRNRNQ